jgi:hypothetical protein
MDVEAFVLIMSGIGFIAAWIGLLTSLPTNNDDWRQEDDD